MSYSYCSDGDYGDIIGIGTQTTGINTTGPAIFFEIKPQPGENYGIYDPDGIPNGSKDKKNISKHKLTIRIKPKKCLIET